MKTKPTVSKMLAGIEKAGKLLLVTGTFITITVQESTGQWNVIGNAGRTNVFPVNIAKIGIGNFPTAPSVQAKLHVNQFLLAANPATDGLLFRTDGNSNQTTMWQLFTGTSATTQTEKFNLTNPANSNDISLNVVQNGSMIFSTHNLPRMKIDSSGMISIEKLRCKRCFVMTNEKGELLTMEAEEVFRQLEQQQAFLMEQQKQIAFLQQEVEALKQEQEKLLCNKQ